MRFNRCTHLMIIILIVCMAGYPQSVSRSITLGTGLGIGIPVLNSSFRDYWENAGNFCLDGQIYLSQQVAFSPRVNYHLFELNQDRFNEDLHTTTSGSGGSLKLGRGRRNTLEMGAVLMFFLTRPSDAIGFYMTAGGSYYLIRYETVKGIFIKNDQKYSYPLREKVDFHGYGPHGGFGLDFWMNDDICFSSEAQLHYLIVSLAPSNDKSGKIESIIFHDSNKIVFLSFLWCIRINL